MDAVANQFLKLAYGVKDQAEFNRALKDLLKATDTKKTDLPIRIDKELKSNPDSLPKTSQEALNFLTYMPLSRFRTGDSWNAMLKILSPEDKKKVPKVNSIWGEQKLLESILAFEDRPFPNSPEPDGGFNRIDQLVDVGMPEAPPVEIREALMVRPYYLGHEDHWMPDACKFPATHKLLKAIPFRGDPKPPEPPKEEVVKEEEMTKTKTEYPAVEKEISKPEYPAVESVLAAEEAEAKQSMKLKLQVENQGKAFEGFVRALKNQGYDVSDWGMEVKWKISVTRRPKDPKAKDSSRGPSHEYEVTEEDKTIEIVSDKSGHKGSAKKGESLNGVVDVVMQDFWKGSEEE